MHKPALAYVVHSLNPGGTERLVIDMSLALSKEYEVHVFCLDEPGAWSAQLAEKGIPIVYLGRKNGIDISVPVRLASHMRKIGATIIHAHQYSAWFYSALSRICYRRPKLLFEEHGRFWPENDRKVRKFFNRFLLVPLTHKFVAVSSDISARLSLYEGIPNIKIEIIYNGVKPAAAQGKEYILSLKEELGITPEDFVIGTVGRLVQIKNIPMLVEALCEICQANAHVKGLIVGDGPERTAIAAMISDAKMNGRIILAGHHDDARKFLSCMNIFTLTSFSEGTSLALLEAQAAGIASAVTAVGGNSEIVIDGVNGWVVPSGDTKSLADVFRKAICAPLACESLGAKGLQIFNEKFTSEIMINSYRTIYLRLLCSKPVVTIISASTKP